jgi:sugar phosphate isomerase/epimerase
LANVLGAKICRPIYFAEKERLKEVITECIPYLVENNMVWCIEVHSPYPPHFYTDVVSSLNSPSVKLLPDFSCWQTMGLPTEYSGNDVTVLKEMLPFVGHVHGKAHFFNEMGEEPFTPYRELLKVLKDNDYKGYVVAEYEGYLLRYDDSRKIAETHLNLIRKYGS